jgi:acyl carrier protein
MESATVEDRVKDIVAELLGVDKANINRSSHFRNDLEADSLDLVELIMEFEKEFGGEIDDEDVQKIETVGQAVEYIEAKMS